MRRWALAGVFAGASIMGMALAAYVPIQTPLPVVPQDVLTRPLGGNVSGQPNQPVGVNQAPGLQSNTPTSLFSPSAVPSPITDGQRYAGLTTPYKPVSPDKSGLVVGLSPTPSLQCPLVQGFNVSTSGGATVVTNPGGLLLHICSIKVISAAQQGISLAEGTGTVCATGETFVDGGSGGTNQVAVNSGWAEVSDRITTPMQKAGDNWCIINSSASNASGKIVYGVFAQ
jgi:hypothetical protein